MRPTQVSEAITSMLGTGQPLFLWGPPGVGKSSVIHQAASARDLPVVDVRAALLDPVDLRGLPTIKDGACHWCPPAFLPRDGEGVLFLDELPQAPPLVQSALLQLCLDRKLGEYELPEGWSIIAAGNRSEDRAGSHRMITPLLNRFLHLDMEVSGDDWQAWAVRAEVAVEVRSFLNFRPALLFSFDPASNPRAFPTPRSWEFVSRVLRHTPAHLLYAVVSGAVGEGPAAEFVGFWKIHKELPDVDLLLASPATAKVPTEPAVLYALVGALSERMRGKDNKVAKAFVTYASRLPAEFSVLAFRDGAQLNQQMLLLPESDKWLKENRKYLGVGK